MLTFKWLMLYSKYFQIRQKKTLNQIFIKNTFHLSVACNLYDLHLKNKTVRSIYEVFKFMYPSMWMKFDKIEVIWLCSTSVLLRGGREPLFSHDNPVLSCQRHSLSSNSAAQEKPAQIVHANLSPQWKLVFGMNDGEVDRNRKQH